MSTRDSEAKLHGLRFPKVPSSLRSLRRPCSGRTAPVPHFCGYQTDDSIIQAHTGPPMAPKTTAWADLAALSASSVNGVP